MYSELGKIVGVWGVKGWVKLHSYTRNRADIANYSEWWIQNKETINNNPAANPPVLYNVVSCREQGQGIVANLAGITDPDQALALNGQRILIKQDEMPTLPAGEYYWKQLIGLSVSNGIAEIGHIDSILETGANDVLVIQTNDNSEVLIPYINDVIKQVDIQQGTLLVDWDPAFLE